MSMQVWPFRQLSNGVVAGGLAVYSTGVPQSSGSLTDVISDHCQSLESSFNTSFTGVKSPAGGSGAPLATDMSRKPFLN